MIDVAVPRSGRYKSAVIAVHRTLSDTVMERLIASCDEAKYYPQNLIHPNTHEYNLTAYLERLNEREDSLFQNHAEAALDLWEFDAQGIGASAEPRS